MFTQGGSSQFCLTDTLTLTFIDIVIKSWRKTMEEEKKEEEEEKEKLYLCCLAWRHEGCGPNKDYMEEEKKEKEEEEEEEEGEEEEKEKLYLCCLAWRHEGCGPNKDYMKALMKEKEEEEEDDEGQTLMKAKQQVIGCTASGKNSAGERDNTKHRHCYCLRHKSISNSTCQQTRAQISQFFLYC